MQELRHGHLVIFEDWPIVLPAILAATSLFFGVNLALSAETLPGGGKEAVGMVLGTILCAFGAVLLFRRDRVVFDEAEKRVRWRKWSLAKTSSGEIAFDDIVDVTMESINTTDGGGSYRVALRTPDGWLHLTETYSGHADDMRPVVSRIRTIIGLKGNRPTDGDTASLLAQGRKIDAVRQLRETGGPDLANARARVEAVERRTD